MIYARVARRQRPTPRLTLPDLSLRSCIRVAVRPGSDVLLACSALESLGAGPEFASHILHQGAQDLERLGVDAKGTSATVRS